MGATRVSNLLAASGIWARPATKGHLFRLGIDTLCCLAADRRTPFTAAGRTITSLGAAWGPFGARATCPVSTLSISTFPATPRTTGSATRPVFAIFVFASWWHPFDDGHFAHELGVDGPRQDHLTPRPELGAIGCGIRSANLNQCRVIDRSGTRFG